MHGHLHINTEPWRLLAAAAVIALLVVVLVRNLRHGSRTPTQVIMETIRLGAGLILSAALLDPTWVWQEDTDQAPEAVILVDHSRSMETEDVPRPDGQGARSRRAWLETVLTEAPLDLLEPRFRVTVEPFAGTTGEADGTDLSAALDRTLSTHTGVAAVCLISDGTWNQGEHPLRAALAYRQRHIPVFTIGAGVEERLPDVVLDDVRPPAFCVLNETVVIPFVVHNHFPDTVHTTIVLTDGAGRRSSKPLTLPPAGRHHDTMAWRPSQVGRQTLVLSVPARDGEVDTDNNRAAFPIDVRHETITVLLIESLPRWEYRFIRNALARDPGVHVHALLFHQREMAVGAGPGYLDSFPATRSELAGYDVVILGDVGVSPNQLSDEQADWLAGCVESQGTGLVFLPGREGHQHGLAATALADLLPVILDDGARDGIGLDVDSQLAATRTGTTHLLTMLADTPEMNRAIWRQLPGFYWHAGILRARPGADTLAVHASRRNRYGRIPLLVTRPFGSGNVLFLGIDAVWRWRRGVEDRYHYRFWGQCMRWMAHKRHVAHDHGMRALLTPERPAQGDTLHVRASAFDDAGFPLQATSIICTLIAPDGSARETVLQREAGEWGTFSGHVEITTAGRHRLQLSCPDLNRTLETPVDVAPAPSEPVGQPARLSVLQGIARTTLGQYGDMSRVVDIIKAMTDLPQRQPNLKRVRIWCQWWYTAAAVALLGVYWTLRKRTGMI